jgi:hypothetical protein
VPDRYASVGDFLKASGLEEVDRRLPWDHPATRDYTPVEVLAKEIYDDFVYDGPVGSTKPSWKNGGNGLKQDEARAMARGKLRAEGHQRQPGEGA